MLRKKVTCIAASATIGVASPTGGIRRQRGGAARSVTDSFTKKTLAGRLAL